MLDPVCAFCGLDHELDDCPAIAAEELLAPCYVCGEYHPLEDMQFCPECGKLSCESEMCAGTCRCSVASYARTVVMSVAVRR